MKKILKILSYLIILILLSVFSLLIMLEKIVIEDIFKSKEQILKEKKARVEFLNDIVKNSSLILKKNLSDIDGIVNKNIDSKNIMFAFSPIMIRDNVPIPLISNIPEFKSKYKEFEYVLEKTFDENSDFGKRVKRNRWYGSYNLGKLRENPNMIFITFKRSIVDKAMEDDIYKEEFKKYAYNIINHEHIHMLGESEYLAAKYGQSFEMDISSKLYEDILSKNVINHIDHYSANIDFSNLLDTIEIKNNSLSDKDRKIVMDMISLIKDSKAEIIYGSNSNLEIKQTMTNRASWIETNSRSYDREYFLILTRGHNFLAKNIWGLNEKYMSYVSLGYMYNIYKLFQENGYTVDDAKIFNESTVESILNIVYGDLRENSLDIVKQYALHSLNYLTDISYDYKKFATEDLINGVIFYNGNLVDKDYKKAMFYLEKASKQGSIRATELLAMMYLNSLGVPKDFHKAISLLEKINSYSDIGTFYYTEDKNYNKAKEYLEKAISYNEPVAMSTLGLMYVRGHGVKKDYLKAKKLFEDSIKVNQNVIGTKNNLAWLYLNGLGVEKDYKKALEFFIDDAKRNSTAAILNLAWIYKNVEYTDVEKEKLRFWYDKASLLSQEEIDSNYELTYNP